LRYILFSICYFICTSLVYSQNQSEIDSLINVLQTDISEKEEVDVYVKIAKAYGTDSSKIYQYAYRAIELAEKNGYIAGKIDADYQLGWINLLLGNYNAAIDIFNQMIQDGDRSGYLKGKTNGYNGLGSIYFNLGQYEKALDPYLKSIEIKKEIGDKKGTTGPLRNVGMVYQNLGLYDKAMLYYTKSITISEELGDDQNVSYCYNLMGEILQTQGKYERALEVTFKALGINERLGDSAGVVDNYIGIAWLHDNQGENDEALRYYSKALRISQETGYKPGSATIYTNSGLIWYKLGQYEKALESYFKGLKIYEELQFQLAYSYNNIGEAYLALGDFDLAKEYCLKALDLSKTSGPPVLISTVNITVGEVYFKEQKWRLARKYLQDGYLLAQELGLKRNIKHASGLLAALEESLGDYKAAYEYHLLFKQMADSLINEEQTRKLTSQELNYEFEKEKDSIQLANQTQQALLEKDVQQARNIQIFALIAAALLGLFVTALVLFLRTKQRANKQLQQLDEARSRFFANISHELRTPLTMIHSPLQVLSSAGQQLSATNQRLLSVAQNNSAKLKELVDDILNLSKLENSQLQLEEQKINIGKSILRIVSNYESLAEHLEIRYENQIESSLEHTWVLLDDDKFEKILNNLLSNAIKFTPPEGRVTVKANTNSGSLIVKVTDTGAGIASEDLPHIFNRFSQSVQPNQLMQGGSGIGLAIVKEYVQLLQGNITVDSELGKGSEFTLTLPMQTIDPPKSEDLDSEEDLPRKDQSLNDLIKSSDLLTNNGQEMTVLIVEDHPQMQQFIKSLLHAQFRTLVAFNGVKALEILEKEKVDLIISDVMMPQMNGYELVEQLKGSEEYFQIPIILLTALGGEEHRIKGLMLGVNDYLQKPFSPQELWVRAHNLLQRSFEAKQEAQNIQGEEELTDEIKSKDLMWLEEVKNTIQSEAQNEKFLATDLADTFHLSERQFRRKLKMLSGLSPKQFQQEVQLQMARELLLDGKFETVKEVSYTVGMQRTARFSNLYEKRFGKRPIDYLNY